MDVRVAKLKFHQQKAYAGQRGIEWRLTFNEWLEWWGKDIENRGRGKEQLQMQRFGDVGPYALDNIKKGHPRDNSRTYRNAGAARRAYAKVGVVDRNDVGAQTRPKYIIEDKDDVPISEYFARRAEIRSSEDLCKSTRLAGRK